MHTLPTPGRPVAAAARQGHDNQSNQAMLLAHQLARPQCGEQLDHTLLMRTRDYLMPDVALLADFGIGEQACRASADDTMLVGEHHTMISGTARRAIPAILLESVRRAGVPVSATVLAEAPPASIFTYVDGHARCMALCIPVLIQGEVAKALYFESEDLGRQFSANEIAMLQFMATQAACAYERQSLTCQLAQAEQRNRLQGEALASAQADLLRLSRIGASSTLAASIAHEVSQPLMAIIANAAAGLRWLDHDQPQPEDVRGVLKDILAAGQRAGHIIQNLRALAQRSEVTSTLVDLHGAIDVALRLCGKELLQRQIEVDLQLFPGSLQVRGDGVQLQQVFLNLIKNAVEAIEAKPAGAIDGSQSGSRKLLQIHSAINGSGAVQVGVGDNGVGLAADITGRLFEPFFSTKKDGMGMGLAICRAIAEAHQGSLQAEPQCSGGSLFTLTLPLHTAMASLNS